MGVQLAADPHGAGAAIGARHETRVARARQLRASGRRRGGAGRHRDGGRAARQRPGDEPGDAQSLRRARLSPGRTCDSRRCRRGNRVTVRCSRAVSRARASRRSALCADIDQLAGSDRNLPAPGRYSARDRARGCAASTARRGGIAHAAV
jgi:hypothetical protein